MTIPISILILTRNNAGTLDKTLKSCRNFDDIHVIDSHSHDGTRDLALTHNAHLHDYTWNGAYPKKKQWALDTIPYKHDWILLLDADEELTHDFIKECQKRVNDHGHYAGFFVRAHNVIRGQRLRNGLHNNKLCLIRKGALHFPAVDDLDCPKMGEIEGHYQPVPTTQGTKIGQIDAPILHHIQHDLNYYRKRHQDYAQWEAHMTHRDSWPKDPVLWRRLAKTFLRRNPLRPYIMFLYSYVIKFGFMDGSAGLAYARDRFDYAQTVLAAQKAMSKNAQSKE